VHATLSCAFAKLLSVDEMIERLAKAGARRSAAE